MHTYKILFFWAALFILFSLARGDEEPAAGNLGKVLLGQAQLFQKLTSLEYTVEDKKQNGFERLAWKEMGNKYLFDYENSNLINKTDDRLISSYDGQQAARFVPEMDKLFIQKKPFTKDMEFISSFCTPLGAFEFISTSNDIVSLRALKSAETFPALALRAALDPQKNRTWFGHPCIAVKITDVYDRWDKQDVNCIVYFASDMGFYPIAWEMYNKAGEPMLSFFITKFATVPIDKDAKVLLPFPESAILRNEAMAKMVILPDNVAPESIYLTGVDEKLNFTLPKINGLTEDGDFQIDPSMAGAIEELDTGTLITIPK
jgi:hypothetical protein